MGGSASGTASIGGGGGSETGSPTTGVTGFTSDESGATGGPTSEDGGDGCGCRGTTSQPVWLLTPLLLRRRSRAS